MYQITEILLSLISSCSYEFWSLDIRLKTVLASEDYFTVVSFLSYIKEGATFLNIQFSFSTGSSPAKYKNTALMKKAEYFCSYRYYCRKGVLWLYIVSTVYLLHEIQTVQVLQFTKFSNLQKQLSPYL